MGDFDVNIRIRAVNLAKKEFKTLQTNFQKLTKTIKKFNAVGARVSAVGAKISQIGRTAAIAGGIITAAFGAATLSAAKFETGLAKVSTLTAGTAQQAIAKFGKEIERLSIETGKPLADLNEGLFQAISAGVEAGDVIQFLGIASKASVAGFTSVETAVEGLGRLFNAYGGRVEDVRKFSDQLFLANKFGVTTFGALASNIGTVAGQASVLGISSGDLLATLTTLTKLTGSTEEATTQLSAVLTTIKKPSDQAKVAIKAINDELKVGEKIDFTFAGLREKGLVGFLNQINTAVSGDVEVLNKLFGVNIRAGRGIDALSLNMKLFNKVAEIMKTAGGETSITLEKFADVMKTAEKRIDVLRQRFIIIVNAIGGSFLPVIEKITPLLEKVGAKILTFVTNNKKLVAIVSILVAVGGAFLTVFGILGILIGGLVSLFGALLPVIGVIVAAFGFLASISSGVFFAIGLLVTVIGALITFFGTLAAVVVAFITGILDGFLEAIGITNFWATSFKILGDIVKTVFGFILGVIKKIVGAIKTAIVLAAGFGKFIGKEFGGGVAGIINVLAFGGLEKIGPDIEKKEKIAGNKAIERVKEVEKMKTKVQTDETKKRLARIKALLKSNDTKADGVSRELIDPFATGPQIRRRGRNALTSAGGAGFGTKAVQMARGSQGGGGKTITIDKVELPNVQDVEGMVDSLFKLTGAGGQPNPGQLS